MAENTQSPSVHPQELDRLLDLFKDQQRMTNDEVYTFIVGLVGQSLDETAPWMRRESAKAILLEMIGPPWRFNVRYEDSRDVKRTLLRWVD